MTDTIQPDDEITYCAVHPTRETGLRCNKCDRYMCRECAVQTPVGYRCRQCVRQVENSFFNGKQADYVIVFAVTAGLSAVVTFLTAVIIPFILLLFFVAVIAGPAIGEAALRAIQRRKLRYRQQAAWAGGAVGALVAGVLAVGGFSLIFILFAGLMAVMIGLRL